MQWIVDDVMTSAVVSVSVGASYHEIADTMAAREVTGLPVVDEEREVVGFISAIDLLRRVPLATVSARAWWWRRRGRTNEAPTAGELMTVPPVVIDLGASVAVAARVLDHERLKRLPVVDGSGRLAGIVSRADLLGVFLRDDEAIEREIREHVLLRTLWTDSTGIAVSVHKGVVALSGVADTPEAVDYLGRLCAGVPGVAEVRNAVVATTKGSRP